MKKKNILKLGITLMLLTTFTFAVQDSFSQILASDYNVILIVSLRYFFLTFCILIVCLINPAKFKKALKTEFLFIQILRGLILALEICVMVYSFTKIGLAKSHAFFSCYPLIVCVLSIPFLNEKIGFFRSICVAFGFLGTLIILRPGTSDFSLEYLIPLLSALLFALYSILTRYVSYKDNTETSLFWVGVVGTLFMSGIIPFFWEPILTVDLFWILILCLIAILGHFFLIKTLETCEASKVQPFAYFQVIFASFFGVSLFSERIDLLSVIGTSVIIFSGVLMYFRETK